MNNTNTNKGRKGSETQKFLEGRLIRGSTILDNFLINSWGVGLYAGRLIREYVRYLFTLLGSKSVIAASRSLKKLTQDTF